MKRTLRAVLLTAFLATALLSWVALAFDPQGAYWVCIDREDWGECDLNCNFPDATSCLSSVKWNGRKTGD